MDKKIISAKIALIVLAVALAGGVIFWGARHQALKNLNNENVTQENEEQIADVESAPDPVNDKENSAASESDTKFSFAIMGDTQRFNGANPEGGFQKAVRSISTKNVNLVMTEGDLVTSCGDDCKEKLTRWRNMLGSISSKTYEVMGNHDRTGKDSSDSAWQNVFKLPGNGPTGYEELVYSFDFKNAHFVVLNSEKPKEHLVDKAQRNWLETDLAANKKENTFVFFHEPAHPVSSKIGESLDVKKKDRDDLWNIFTKYNVTAVFNGHEHIHSRRKVEGLYQFVFGNTDSFDHDLPAAGVAEYSYKGKSFGIVEVDGKQITVNLFSVEGDLLNSFKFND